MCTEDIVIILLRAFDCLQIDPCYHVISLVGASHTIHFDTDVVSNTPVPIRVIWVTIAA